MLVAKKFDEFQSPSLRGSGRFDPTSPRSASPTGWSQSPSLRGSGRFIGSELSEARVDVASLNPLHCGAVVASRVYLFTVLLFAARVSIPFIAGQWSLPSPDNDWVRFLEVRLNPLHCGAVVASADALNQRLRHVLSQSPSLRGSGRFRRSWRRRGRRRPSFNPLHCGAVVASYPPFAEPPRPSEVSIPFIAGQWSLRGGLIPPRRRPPPFQSPSLRGSGRFEGDPFAIQPCLPSFNPLHCGAVVASPDGARARRMRARVSIPFIAGQWSLRSDGSRLVRVHPGVSIPFIAGQWSLLKKNNREPRAPD